MHTFKRQTYSGQVVEFIKRCILDGELAPGEQVKEVILSDRLGISRAPIREALQILTQDGLITSEPQKGKYIRKMRIHGVQTSGRERIAKNIPARAGTNRKPLRLS